MAITSFPLLTTGCAYVIAEAGVNHDGRVEDAHLLVDLAAEVGADAVKFQTFDPATLVSDRAQTAPYQLEHGGGTSQRDMLDRYVLADSAWVELAEHARERGVDFLSTPMDTRGLDLLCELGVPALKIGSGELTNEPFLREVAARGLPVMLSTGMGTGDEVARALDWASEAPALLLFHCVSSYPAPLEQANLRAIATMRERHGVPVGWSDHTIDELTAVVATAFGAQAFEKHLTLDRRREGPDHEASADGPMFTRYVQAIRQAESALGDGVKRPTPAELANVEHVRRSWHAVRDLPAGAALTAADVVLLRPATGLAPSDSPVGATLREPVAAGASVRAADLA